MSEVKNKKKKSSMIQVSIGVLAVILAILIIMNTAFSWKTMME